MITSLSKLYFKFRRFIFYGLWQLHKQLKTMKMSKAWLILAMRDKYVNSNLNPLAKFTSSSRSTVFKDVHPWNISQMITKTVPVSPRIVKSYVMRQGILLWIWWKVTGNWDSNMIRISRWTESHCRTNTSVRRKKWIQKGRTMGITVWNPSRKVNHLSKIIWDRKTITEFTRSISSTRIGKPVLMMDVKVSKDKNISRWVDRENLIYVRWNRIKNRAQRRRRWSIEEKEERHWVK